QERSVLPASGRRGVQARHPWGRCPLLRHRTLRTGDACRRDRGGNPRFPGPLNPPIEWRTVMRAIVLEKFGGLDSLVYEDIPEPEPKAGHVLIQIKAFGLNHAELHMRRGEWAEAARVSGIECVGLVKSCPGGEFPVGAKVAALMGGLGRTINGSY